MDQEQIDKQNDDDFNTGFNAVRPSDDYVPPEEKPPAEPIVEANDPAPEPAPEPEKVNPIEEPLFAGMTEAQIKSLLERSARVDGIEDQLSKAHGKIGELNRTLQELKSSQAKPTPSAPAANAGQVSEFEETYPEFVAIAESRARKIAEEIIGRTPQAAPPDNIKAELQQDVQLGIMDAVYPDWRETVNSQDFALWIATQTPELQQTYANTWNARELGGVVTSFKNWKQTASDRAAKSKERLEAALIPDVSSSKVSHAPSAQDEFLAGFNAVRGQR